jgi:hypothetical protein
LAVGTGIGGGRHFGGVHAHRCCGAAVLRCCGAAVLRVMGHPEEQQFQKFHRILNRVKWSPLAASQCLLLALMETFVPQGPLVMALDDTIELRQGARIAAKGIYRDPVRYSHSYFVKDSGLR